MYTRQDGRSYLYAILGIRTLLLRSYILEVIETSSRQARIFLLLYGFTRIQTDVDGLRGAKKPGEYETDFSPLPRSGSIVLGWEKGFSTLFASD